MSSYIDNPSQVRAWGVLHPGHFWGAHTFDRLAWRYGHAKAQAIRAGRDPATQADLAAWDRLCAHGVRLNARSGVIG